MSEERYQRGLDTLRRINPQAIERVHDMLKDVAPDMARFIIEFPYGDIYSRAGLSLPTRELITIASLTTLGHAGSQLKVHITHALKAGCSKEEVVETIMQMAVYAGFPAALNGLLTAREAFKEMGLL